MHDAHSLYDRRCTLAPPLITLATVAPESCVLTSDRQMCTEPLLHTAVKAGHLSIVQLLVAAGADVNAVCDKQRTPLREALETKHAAVVEYLRGVGAFEKCLQVAASEGDVVLVQAWLLARSNCVHDVGW